MKPAEFMLSEAAARELNEKITDLCKSMASFIAEIDASSADVAAYLEQRLGPLLRHPGIRLFLDDVGRDARKLQRAMCPNCGEVASLDRGCFGMPKPACVYAPHRARVEDETVEAIAHWLERREDPLPNAEFVAVAVRARTWRTR